MSNYNCAFQARMHHAVTDTGSTGRGANPIFCRYSNHEIEKNPVSDEGWAFFDP